MPLGYIARTQMPAYDQQVAWQNQAEQDGFMKKNGLRFMRAYQQRAALAIQLAVKEGKTRFLLDQQNATGFSADSAATAIVAMKYYFKAVPPAWRAIIPEYVKDYVPLNQFM